MAKTRTTRRSDEFARMHEYWQAANYLPVGQVYLQANALLREPLKLEHVKPRLLGHWGTTPGIQLRLPALEPRHQGRKP